MRHGESRLQATCVKWFRLQYPKLDRLLFAVPNGGYRSRFEAAILNGEGVVSGVSDLILLIPSNRYASLCIEMKSGRNRQTDNQKAFQAAVEATGNKYVVCRTFDEFVKIIKDYLS